MVTRTSRSTRASRRRLLKSGGAAALLAGAAPSVFIPGRAKAQQKTLRILQFKHFVPSYDEWFSGTYVKEWGEQNDTKVIVDYVGLADLSSQAKAEIEARRGHDLVIFVTPAGIYEDQVIDHREIYEESERKIRQSQGFRQQEHLQSKDQEVLRIFSRLSAISVITYRSTCGPQPGVRPDSWSDISVGGRQIRLLQEKPVGFSLASEDNSNYAMRTIMYCFGASEQDGDGNPALKSEQRWRRSTMSRRCTTRP